MCAYTKIVVRAIFLVFFSWRFSPTNWYGKELATSTNGIFIWNNSFLKQIISLGIAQKVHIKLSSLPSFLDFKGLAILLFNSNVYSLKASTLSEERGFPQAIDAISNFEARASGSSSGVAYCHLQHFISICIIYGEIVSNRLSSPDKYEIILDLYIWEKIILLK